METRNKRIPGIGVISLGLLGSIAGSMLIEKTFPSAEARENIVITNVPYEVTEKAEAKPASQPTTSPSEISESIVPSRRLQFRPDLRMYPNMREVYAVKDFSEDDEKTILARMIYGEARGCSIEERIAVAYTAINRSNDGEKWNGTNVKEVILKPWQYICFNEDNTNRAKLMDPMNDEPEAFLECLSLSENVLNGKYKDPTEGATHYFEPHSANPDWAHKIEKIGKINTSKGLSNHIFYREN